MARTLARTLFRSNTLNTDWDPADRTLPAGEEVEPTCAFPAAPETVPGVAPTFFAVVAAGGRVDVGALATRIVVVVMFSGFLPTGFGVAGEALVAGGTLIVVVVLALAVWGAGGFFLAAAAAVAVEGMVDEVPAGFLTGVADVPFVLEGRPVREGVALRDPATEVVVEEGAAKARAVAATTVTFVAVVEVLVLVGVGVEGALVIDGGPGGFGEAGVLAVELPVTVRRAVVWVATLPCVVVAVTAIGRRSGMNEELATIVSR